MDVFNLWDIDVTSENKVNNIVSKVNNPKKVKVSKEINIKSKKLSIPDKLRIINDNVEKTLGVYKDSTEVIRSYKDLENYFIKAVDNGIIAVDTETNNSLDPLTCDIMGLCLYTPNRNSVYIPVNHTDLNGERYGWQVSENDLKTLFETYVLNSDVKVLMHNGKFDYKVIYCTCGVKLPIHWDSMIGAKLLNENEHSAGLKQQYIDKIDSSIEKYSIDHLFEAIEYKYVDPEVFALYAATDAYMTYKLYEYQIKEFNKPGHEKLLNLMTTVEMPIVIISAEMELQGICIDFEYSKRLSNKYHSMLDEINKRLNEELKKLEPEISKWRTTKEANFHPESGKLDKNGNKKYKKSKNEQLENPPALTSPTQLSILLYDILKVGVVDKNNPRGTGEDVLKKIDLPLVKVILEHRSILKLLDAFIDVLPKLVSERDNRLHSNFNQLGTGTGRFSSTSPNLQQIPAKNKEVRMMFSASPGYMLVSSDYGQQEPRILTAYSRDQKLLDAYNNERDLYATLGTAVFHNDYWDNMEHYEDGSPNVEGKKRRKKMKVLYLGIAYGMGARKLANDMGCSLDEASTIINDFHSGFTAVSSWMRNTEEEACKNGYVEDFWGRRRRLPDLLLPEYEIKCTTNSFNPLLNTSGTKDDNNLIDEYKYKLSTMKSFKEYDSIKKEAESRGVSIKSNGGFISRSKRQCVNARIQGGAATMTKKAMIDIYNDPIMKELGFRLLVGIHDELLGECPAENAEKASDRLVYLMKNCVPELDVPIKCDPVVEEHWLEEEYTNMILAERDNGLMLEDICSKHEEFSKEKLESIYNS